MKGVIHTISPTQNVSERFRKRELILMQEDHRGDEHPVKFEFINDRCDILDSYAEGEEVTVAFDVRGRFWTNRDGVDVCFNSLTGWRVIGSRAISARHSENSNRPKQSTPSFTSTSSKATEAAKLVEEDDGDLPF